MVALHHKNIALILAAGRGSRLSSQIPKQYLPIGKQTILERTITTFLGHPQIDHVAVVINQEHLELYNQHIMHHDKLLLPIIGGETRQASSRLGLEAIAQYNPDNVLIHCAARLFLVEKYITQLLSHLAHNQASCLVDKVKDTMRCIEKDSFKTIERDHLYAIQTPQAFRYNLISKLHQKFQHLDLTDDIALMEPAQMQKEVSFIAAPDFNLKVTTEQDYNLAKIIIEHYEKRDI